MNQGLIPNRYAKAICEFATEKGADEQMYHSMRALADAFAAEPALAATMANPFVSDADKIGLLRTAAAVTDKDTVYADTLKLLARNGRLDGIRDIALAYIKLYRERHGIKKVSVTSAAPLAPAEEERLKAMLAAHIGGGTMEYESAVDPDLIGGFSVSIGNEKLDASLAGELKRLRLDLLGR